MELKTGIKQILFFTNYRMEQYGVLRFVNNKVILSAARFLVITFHKLIFAEFETI
jgi:hypothetical protein